MSAGWQQALQVALSTVAGFVDAIGFLWLGGIYVAFMSGNSTLLGIGAGSTGTDGSIPLSAGMVACFVAGVVLGMLGGGLMRRRRPFGMLLLLGAGLAGAVLLSRHEGPVAGGLVLAAAMGLQNTVFNRSGVSGVGLTYMTGTLVRFGQRVAEALSGGGWAGAVPDLLLWLGMVAGAALGALAFRMLGPDGLWIAVGCVLVVAGLALWAARAPASPQ